jgi:hypothetical protein
MLHSYLMIMLRLSISNFICLVFNYYACPIGQNLSAFTAWFHTTVISSCSHTALGICEYQFYAVSVHNFLRTE